MNKAEAKNIVINALDYKYEIKSFEAFLSNLFKNLTFFDKLKSKTPESFKSVIDSYTQLGEFTDSQNNRISILEVSLNQQNSIGKARSTQRNFIAHYLKNNNYVAALVAFISKDSTDWRLSLVKLEFVAEFIDDKLKSKDEITPARRWSFLVGEHEGCHTAISRFVPLIESAYEPNLEELEYAFNIEKVTDEFYEKYKNLFLIIKDELDRLILKDEKIKNDFVTKQLKTEDFAKKTLGQLAFIYFLQKKGWFGVKPGENWTTGSKLFLRDLYNKKSKYGTNFFNDVLEFLFYEALATDRGSESIYKKFDCKIPFLNGGLFEPMNGYSWETTEILLNDQLFSNSNITPEGDIGDGILDVFDRYNFTVNESEPLEKEVAVDPEMLGKVFENLLGVNDRKSKGAFYTPREIVHYICQEALIEYLNTNLNNEILLPGIRKFVSLGIIDEIEIYSSNVDELLSELKVCDPAVGSGAFPLGMLNEIVRLRQILNLYLKKNKTKYQLKLETISNSLYGVDVDSGAIEIAKLRMWLSLVVDEDNPSPLPNLDHKLMQGNSLVSKFHGIEIFDDNLLLTNKNNLEIIKKLEEHKKSLESKFLELSQNNFLTEKLNLELTELKKELKKINKNITDIKVEKPQLINHSSNLLFGEKEEDEEIAVKKSHELQQKIKL